MKKKSIIGVTLFYIIIILLTTAATIIAGRYYTIYINHPYQDTKIKVAISDESVVEAAEVQSVDDTVKITLKSLHYGTASVKATVYNAQNVKESTTVYSQLSVLHTGIIFLSGYEFGGFIFVLAGITVMSVASFIIFVLQFNKRRKMQFFSYKTVLDLALLLYFGLQSLLYLVLLFVSIYMPEFADPWQIVNIAGFVMSILFLLSLPLLVLFAGFLCASNLSLIYHEGMRLHNLFGIGISAALFLGAVACVIVAVRFPNSTGMSGIEVRGALIRTAVSSAFVYGECLLLSAFICTLYAAAFKPQYNQDFIIILGCRIKADGTPMPLLQGRIDRALAFYHKQLEESGKQACFIPSGGKGDDEIISEAESMKNYLVAQGIEEDLIFPETRSTTTLENMLFSKEIADAHKENANILFSTTNYHIFRSGLFSAKAGMRASGIGAKTKWYFWPNAQMREFIGLLASEWKINLLFIFFTTALSTLFANLPAIVQWLVT